MLAVELLLHEAGAASDRSNCKRVVPLFETLDDDAKVAWLAGELETGRPLLRRGDFEKLVGGDFVEDAVDRDVLKTCAYVAEAPPDTFGAYVISQATSCAETKSSTRLQCERIRMF